MLHGSLKAFQRAGGARRAGVAARPLLGIFAAIGPMPLHVAAAPAGLDKALFATVAAPITPAFAAMAPVVSVSSRYVSTPSLLANPVLAPRYHPTHPDSHYPAVPSFHAPC